LNIRDLQYLVAVYELKSFSKAADRCFVSQPTLSGQIKKLEASLDVQLIERSTRRILFTSLGEKVVEQARTLLALAEDIKQLTQQKNDPMEGDFHIGLIPTVGPYLLPKIIPSLKRQYPQLNLFLYELQTSELIDRLINGELDMAILAKLDWNYPIREWCLYKESLMLAVCDSDPLASSQTAVDQQLLEGRKMLMLQDGHCLRDQALDVCFAEGAKEDKSFQATSMNTLLQMVASGAGSTLVPELACDKDVKGVTFLPFSGVPPCREIVMVGRRSGVRKSAIEVISNLVISIIKQTI